MVHVRSSDKVKSNVNYLKPHQLVYMFATTLCTSFVTQGHDDDDDDYCYFDLFQLHFHVVQVLPPFWLRMRVFDKQTL